MTTTYRLPPAGRKYIEAANQADQTAREAARAQAAEFSDVIHATQKLQCPANDGKFKHFLNNDLICARCDQTAYAILKGDTP